MISLRYNNIFEISLYYFVTGVYFETFCNKEVLKLISNTKGWKLLKVQCLSSLSSFQFVFSGTLIGSILLPAYIALMLEYLSFPKCNLHGRVNEPWKNKKITWRWRKIVQIIFNQI